MLREQWGFLTDLSALSLGTCPSGLGLSQVLGLCLALTILSNQESPSFPSQESSKEKSPQLCVLAASHREHVEA